VGVKQTPPVDNLHVLKSAKEEGRREKGWAGGGGTGEQESYCKIWYGSFRSASGSHTIH
jgi:hypothetical protein